MDHAIESATAAAGPAAAAPGTELPRVRRVSPARTLVWLRRGLADVSATSVLYGAVIAGCGLLLLGVVVQASYLVPALVGGFLLVAPFAAIVLYGMSRQIEAGEPPDATRAVASLRRQAGSIALFGLMLAFALIAWERLAAIIFALSYGGRDPDLSNFLADVLFSGEYGALLLAFFGAGALFAATVFALSVVTAPLLLDRDLDVVIAALTSLRCCTTNPATMLLWAAIIAVITALGVATFMLGLVVAFPLLGHASWHAYRELVE